MQRSIEYSTLSLHEKVSNPVMQAFQEQLNTLYTQRYQTPYGCLWAPADTDTIDTIIHEAVQKKLLNPSAIIVIGIGGSYLGTKAVYEVLSEYVDELCPLIFIDTFDVKGLHRIHTLITEAVYNQKNILINVVTKSGTTSETLVNFQLIYEWMKKGYPASWQELIVIISDKYSLLTEWGRTQGCLTLSIPSALGGRYSVFTAVGLFPLALVGIDVKELCDGAATYMRTVLDNSDNVSLHNALFVYEQYSKGYKVYDLFLFEKSLESLGKWYRQLLAESLGKENKENIKITLTPSVSIGTLELHSVAQLLLGAQPPIITTFVTVGHVNNDITLVQSEDTFFKYHTTSVHTLMNQAAHATQKAYEMVGLPYDTITLPLLTPFYIGQFLQLYIVQVLYLAELMQVNPFDQPHVELYKTIMKRSETTP